MKKFICLVLLSIINCCFSQAITVNTTNYSVPQLVNNVLINAPCTSATNISFRTGTTFGSTNGIGYFENTNGNFPIQSGVILSTGAVSNSGGPNNSQLNDGSATWTGDTDLETTLAQSGIIMNSVNATVLEFDFTPISRSFSFDFLFASEEYGNFQCQYSDAFAFLLTNTVTGITTNLAVVPNTNLPISVITIRDFLYNSSCPSANAQYFGSYNGGSAALNSATNFNGQTKLLNASALLTPNVLYHIKLVLADRLDSNSDSAIFLSSNSFNIGQDVLGPDLTVVNNAAICAGTRQILNSNLSVLDYRITWTRNGIVIPGATLATLSINQPGIYGITFTPILGTCQPATDFITVEYLPAIAAKTPINLYKCDLGLSSYDYNLALNTPIVKVGLDPLAEVSYYLSQTDAEAGTNILPSIYNSTPGSTIYVKVKNPTNSCFVIKTFQLLTVIPLPARQPPNLSSCSSSASASFTLAPQTSVVLNGQSSSIFRVTYHATLANAIGGTSVLGASITASNNTTVFARLQNKTDPTCYTTTSFALIVRPNPTVDTLAGVVICDPYTLPALTNGNYFTGPNGTGTPLFAGAVIPNSQTIYIYSQPDGLGGCFAESSFSILILDPLTLIPTSGSYCDSYTLPPLLAGRYFDGPGGTGNPILAGTVVDSTRTLYFNFQSVTYPFCFINTDFTVTIIPKIAIGTFVNAFDCSSYTLPNLTAGNYFTAPNGGGAQLNAGSQITTSQLIYVLATTGTPINCISEASFNVVIGLNPQPVLQCDPYVLPVLPVGEYFTQANGGGVLIPQGATISTTQVIYIFVPNVLTNPNCTNNINFLVTISLPVVAVLPNVRTCSSYTLPTITNGDFYTGNNGTGTLLAAGTIINSNQTIYIFKRLFPDCFNQSSFTVVIIPMPVINSRSDIDICNSYALTPLSAGNYYTGPNGTGALIPMNSIITTSQSIYIYAITNTSPVCTAQNSFNLTILSVLADAPVPVNVCNSYVLRPLTNGNYYTLSGGPETIGNIRKQAGDTITTSTTLYIYNASGDRIICSAENVFNITISAPPVLPLLTNQNVCNAYTLPIQTIGNYFTGPNGTGTNLPINSSVTSSQTIFLYEVAATYPFCTSQSSFDIFVSTVEATSLNNVKSCNRYILPPLTNGNYYTLSGGPSTPGNNMKHAGDVIVASITLYIYTASGNRVICSDETNFDITIIPTPILDPISNLNVCNSYTLPSLAVGNYYTGPNGTGNSLFSGDILTTSQSISVYAQTGTNPNCAIQGSFYVAIFNVVDIPNITACSYVLPALDNGNYFTQNNGNGIRLFPGTTITTNQTIYIHGESPVTPVCYDDSSFTVTIVNTPIVNQVPLNQRSICDYEGANNGVALFNLTPLNSTILGNQSQTEFNVSYYSNYNNAVSGVNTVVSTYQNLVYVKVDNTLTTNCYDIQPLALVVNKLPDPVLTPGYVCIESKTGVLLNPFTIESGLSPLLYNQFIWTNEAGNTLGNATNFQAVLPGIYNFKSTSILTGCESYSESVRVLTSEPAIVSYTQSEYFSENQTITVIASGEGGNYEYQLDSGVFQDSPIFENVSSGNHIVTVRDKNGCGNSVTNALLVNYPKFFTPDNDGFNDTWNIDNLKDLPNAVIYIFDQMGKLLKQIKPSEQGWDGTYNGYQMPSTDYWFKVIFEQNGKTEEFKSHFSMKR